ncbi:MAG: Gfo/Idh/MocA family oxidoreductase [Algoriphagus sp.]|jgi:myo-inositol 2-dehydrogenase / D-chiro-inositol 1-dehydrogenase|uniref:Gfo/Idh/MocA family protein n=1 Tax=Algoriphagus sp. TaxID=1872435 RepID=UPI002745C346|nr:Gfo/Idh/MocA family oxidoreductase [Algoriphagus sp.]MDP4747743.1 Gfo/Idh/MocA family oxidoreductase [Algoriphagus sp.]MDP4838105.1 Gfo/Idh/MocA family oxidoreductase [Algoriphagus sp.]MDP4956687.1 Gfo/Idh/MocA family oxidoreductase [Algoriphagus sp.]
MKRRNFIKKSALATAAFGIPTLVPASVFGKNAPSNQIQVGQIGCGRIARDHDLPGVFRHAQARVIAAADLDSNRVELGKKFIEDHYSKKMGSPYLDVKTYTDYRDLLQNKEIDAVVISTPDHWHSQPAMEAALAGKHVYLQKPTSLTIKEGRQLVQVVEKTGVKLQLGTQQRSSEQFRLAAELVRNGRIGTLHTVRVGLPGDPPGPDAPAMPIPANLNFDMWLGSTPEMPYSEIGVHPQQDFSRPGWLRHENYGAGMITGWGQHHFDSAAWGMDTEFTGPTSIEAVAEFPRAGFWNVHGDFMVKATYANGVDMYCSGNYPNGIRYEGTEGWIWVSRGSYVASTSDPVAQGNNAKALDASDPKLLLSLIGENEIKFTKSSSHHGNWLEAIQGNAELLSPVEIGHRACSVCLLSHIAMKLGRKLNWDPTREEFVGDAEANTYLSRTQRGPWGTDKVFASSKLMSSIS